MVRSTHCPRVRQSVRWEGAQATQNLHEADSRRVWSATRSDCASKKRWKWAPRPTATLCE
ncbi:hypothetical protein F9C28_01565 [Shimwellia pseudoproteus]|uniref:hypothetical protein n=1 Tax=Shimwellia pseudoproteus TaxID=570012 RepID=UPI0018EC9337|nr:hypothetical protein [Shimwellia pseudoproteus]MBJ3813649.1 hypothetical protein [Shimwellia pseudoproteus]